MQCLCSSQKKRGKCGTCVESLVGAPAPTPTPDALPDCPSEWSFVNDIPWVSNSTLYTPQGLCAAIKKWNDKNPSNLFFGSDQTQNKYQLAAFLGNSAQETGEGKYGTELCDGMVGGCGSAAPGSPCGSKGTCCERTYGNYFGRGSLQVTCWQCTVAGPNCPTPQPLPCGDAGLPCANYQDVVTQGFISSLSDIDQIATDPVAAWGSGIIYWMSNSGVGSKPATQWVSQQNFGGTYQTINGGCECDPEATCEAKSESDCSGSSSTPPGTDCAKDPVPCVCNHKCKWNSNAKGGKGLCMDERVEPRVDGFLTACAKFGIDCSAWQTSCPAIPCTPGAWCGSSWTNAQDNCRANPPVSVCCTGPDAPCQKAGLPGEGTWKCKGGLTGCPAPSPSIGP